MSVPDQTPYIIHNANGVSTVFAFEFYIIAASDLRVAVNGTDVTSGFTVSGTGNTRGGEITFSTPPASGSEILIERQISALRLTEYQNNGDLLAETVNKDFDRLWMSNKRSEIYLDLALQRPLTGGEFDANGFQIKNLEKPSADGDAATKGYSDELYVEFTGKADQLNDAFKYGMYGYITLESFQKGARLTLRNHALKDEQTGEFYRWDGDWSEPKVIPAGSTPESAGGIGEGKWVGVGDAALRAGLASDNGDSLIGLKALHDGAIERTQRDKNADSLSITDFVGALVGKENDSTVAFKSAYKTGIPVYVPAGEWFTHTFDPDLTYGEGVIYSDNAQYLDSGIRPLPPFPNNNKQYVTHHSTRGNMGRATGRGIIVNDPGGRVEISAFSSPTQYGDYPNVDSCGLTVQMSAPKNPVVTTAASTTYTAYSFTAPEVSVGSNIQIGDFVTTTHSPRYKGKVLGINFDTQTVTVDGWFIPGNKTVGQIPADGSSARVNWIDKIWAGYFVCKLDRVGLTGTGFELGFEVTKLPGNPVWGWHAVNYSTLYRLQTGHRSTGMWETGFYASGEVNYAVLHNIGSYTSGTSGVRVNDLDANVWVGSAVDVNTNFRKATSYLARIITGGVTHFSITSQGVRSQKREAVTVIGVTATLTSLSASNIICNNTSEITITLPTGVPAGTEFEIMPRGTAAVVVSGNLVGGDVSVASQRYASFIFDGTNFYKKFSV